MTSKRHWRLQQDGNDVYLRIHDRIRFRNSRRSSPHDLRNRSKPWLLSPQLQQRTSAQRRPTAKWSKSIGYCGKEKKIDVIVLTWIFKKMQWYFEVNICHFSSWIYFVCEEVYCRRCCDDPVWTSVLLYSSVSVRGKNAGTAEKVKLASAGRFRGRTSFPLLVRGRNRKYDFPTRTTNYWPLGWPLRASYSSSKILVFSSNKFSYTFGALNGWCLGTCMG